jgi:hypothetical protein
MSTTAKILYDAADLIDANGWCQREMKSNQGCYCAMGAINAVTLTPLRHPAWDAVREEIFGGSISSWNDHPDRTVDQVTTALRNAARTAEEDDR